MAGRGREHWDRVYETVARTDRSWYRAHLEISLELIGQAASDASAAIIDVGAGESTLVDDLEARGYSDVTVLDVSDVALAATRRRLGDAAAGVHWVCGDVTAVELPAQRYDVWHDRAAFHFLTDVAARSAYVDRLTRSLRPGGHAIIGAFATDGPPRCSGLDVVRYDEASLLAALGSRFERVRVVTHVHRTPGGKDQPFVWCHARLRAREP